MKQVAGKHRRRKIVGTMAPLGLVAVGWLGMGLVPQASVPAAAPKTDAVPRTPVTAGDQGPVVGQADQANAGDLQLAASTRQALLDTADLTDIPAKALAAYQRAALVIDSSDKSCHLDWTTLAAIGKVESDHGRDARGTTTEAGVFGIALNGKHHTKKVADTDGGKLDGDEVWDRAVGPMQFLPSTWSVVGVDGNGDGVRDPQNIADSALGAAVYLCGNGEDLATKAGARSAVGRYNHSSSYIDLVLQIAREYAASAPAYSSAPLQAGHVYDATPVTKAPAHTTRTKTTKKTTKTTKHTSGSTSGSTDPSAPTTGSPSPSPSDPTTGGSGSTPAATQVAVPNVQGMTLDAAGQALIHAGLKPGAVTYVYSSSVAADQVISSVIPANYKVDEGKAIPMTVSAGAVPTVPAGKTVEEATTYFATLPHPITVSTTVTHESSTTVAKDIVVTSTPVAQDAAPGYYIVLTISDGPGTAAQ